MFKEDHLSFRQRKYMKVKNIIGRALGGIGLVVLSPVYLAIIVAIKKEDGITAPVFFSQKRVGIHKEYFNLYKFRSMRTDTPHDKPTHLLENPDQYITKVGHFLRKSSLDELPQLWNIARGDMAVIGPRPALWNQDDLIAERDKYGANDVKPGLTGWAQINGRDELEIPVKARLDGEYVKKMGPLMDIRTMGYTDHLFYLICHSFKHFLHSGFGIRQVCDIILFANEYGDAIDWEKVLRQCREIHADLFAAALFAIGEKYLTFDPEKAHYPKVWQGICVDETDMLMDLLDSGIYGNANMSRKHSSNMTLDAVAADKNGKKAGNTVLKSLFPSAKKLEGRYPYLKKHPILLPIAWTDRILKYRKETVAGGDNAAADSVKIGNQRIELMKKYGIIKK